MKKLAASILLLGLFSTSQAEDTYYVPIQNLVPISYNPLTTNYNPDYDNYTWQAPVQRVQQVSSSPVSQDKAKLNQLDSQYRDRISNMGNGGFFDLLQQSALGNQDKQMMNAITGDSGSGGCGSRGGPGWRKANGQCASWSD